MKKLFTLTLLALLANVASAIDGGINVGFKSKLVEQGVVTGTNLISAGANIEVSSFGLGVNTFSTYDTTERAVSGPFKRVDLTATYKFTSDLADLRLGTTYKNASKSAAFNDVRDNLLPFIQLSGKVFTVLPWSVKMTNDTKNRTNNFQADIKAPVGTKKFKLVPYYGVAFNDPGTTTIEALQAVKKYHIVGIGFAYVTKVGTVGVNGYAHRNSLTSSQDQITSYDAGYSFTF